MTQRNAWIATTVWLATWPNSTLWAHEGHGHSPPGQGETWWHYFSEPEHLPYSLGSVAALLLLAYLGWRTLRWLRLRVSSTASCLTVVGELDSPQQSARIRPGEGD